MCDGERGYAAWKGAERQKEVLCDGERGYVAQKDVARHEILPIASLLFYKLLKINKLSKIALRLGTSKSTQSQPLFS